MYDYREAGLSPVDRAICDYALKLTKHPETATQGDIDQLRMLGLTDEQISIVVQVISYFNYINRIADGLGVDPEPWMSLDRDEWLSRKARDY